MENKVRYYGDGSFWDENVTGNYYETTSEYEQSLHQMINEYPSPDDVARIVPDANGKPVFTVIEIDYKPIYRKRREYECFEIINRGVMWHNSLTETQKQELQDWYQAWLDVTDTLVRPETPAWLK